jgi:hypothetical protein
MTETDVRLEVKIDNLIDDQLLEEHITKVEQLRAAETGGYSVILTTENHVVRGEVELPANKTIPYAMEKRSLPKVVFITEQTPVGEILRTISIEFILDIKPPKPLTVSW